MFKKLLWFLRHKCRDCEYVESISNHSPCHGCWLHDRWRKRQDIQYQHVPVTCDNCIHLYNNNDGSVGCDSPFERACLLSEEKAFKELK